MLLYCKHLIVVVLSYEFTNSQIAVHQNIFVFSDSESYDRYDSALKACKCQESLSIGPINNLSGKNWSFVFIFWSGCHLWFIFWILHNSPFSIYIHWWMDDAIKLALCEELFLLLSKHLDLATARIRYIIKVKNVKGGGSSESGSKNCIAK